MPRSTLRNQLHSDQRRVFDAIFDWLKKPEQQPFLTVGGYAGTGKTTLIAFVRKQLSRNATWKKRGVGLCCYTGKAANVLRQKLGDLKALRSIDQCSTIHRLIYQPIYDERMNIVGWERRDKDEFAYDLIIVDEASMVNETIWEDLLYFERPILVVGDHGQLPPIEGKLNLMREPMLKLEEIVRQEADNPIIKLAHQVRQGQIVSYGKYGRNVMKVRRLPSDTQRHIFSRFDDQLLVLCGYNRTRLALNHSIRQQLGFSEAEPQVGERLICLKNNRRIHLYNGMLGWLREINQSGNHWYRSVIELDGETEVFNDLICRYQFGREKTFKTEKEVDQLRHRNLSLRTLGDLFDWGYALTVHKAQGSEAANVILFEERLPHTSDEMWFRWLYTAITRAAKNLIIVGQS